MSRSTNTTFTCPCGEVFSNQIYEYVNVAQEPQLQYTVLAGLLNVATCPRCGRRVAVSRPFIYSDPEHKLLAYVHPRNDVPEEARLLILERLQSTYDNIISGSDGNEQTPLVVPDDLAGRGSCEGDLPPLQVIFGLDQLGELISGVLSQEERLGRLALNTQSHDEAERGQLLIIARKLASEMQCQVEVEELPDEYTVWLYGSRRQIGALMRELAHHR